MIKKRLLFIRELSNALHINTQNEPHPVKKPKYSLGYELQNNFQDNFKKKYAVRYFIIDTNY